MFLTKIVQSIVSDQFIIIEFKFNTSTKVTQWRGKFDTKEQSDFSVFMLL